MFTGIVDHLGEIQSIEPLGAGGLRLEIRSHFPDLTLGESIAVDGACLTVTARQHGLFTCELSVETCRLTIANQYAVKQPVNLERALRLSDRIGGHWVTGHIDGVCRVAALTHHETFLEVELSDCDKQHLDLLHQKGSVALNGVSLTVNELTASGFRMMLIPHTVSITHFKYLKVGDILNIEYDWLAKRVKHQLMKGVSSEIFKY